MGCGASSKDKYATDGAAKPDETATGQPAAADKDKPAEQAKTEPQAVVTGEEEAQKSVVKLPSSLTGEEEVQKSFFRVPTGLKDAFSDATSWLTESKALQGSLGVVRLDYHYPPSPGDIDHPGSYDYDVYYRMVKGLTFEMCQAGTLTPEVEKEMMQAVKDLSAKGVSCITGDCGFMMWYQDKIRKEGGSLPVSMSSLVSLPSMICAYGKTEKILILTANGETLKPMYPLLQDECDLKMGDERYIISGCKDVPGFDAVELGLAVDVAKVTPEMVKKVQAILAENPAIKAILSECTELPPYSDALRKATGLPVFDAITNCDFFVSGRMDNPRFGSLDWDEAKTNQGSSYGLDDAVADIGQGTADAAGAAADFLQDVGALLTKPLVDAADTAMSVVGASQRKAFSTMARAKASNAKLGVIRIDYDYPPSPGDIDHPGSYPYEVVYEKVEGFTFEMCQAGTMTDEVKARFIAAIKKLEEAKVSVIAGDCGFMMWHQALARENTSLPVVLSSLASCPTVTSAYHTDEQIAILTANGKTLEPMRDLIRDECNVNVEDGRYIIVGCEDIPGFEAVEKGEKVDVPKVTPGMVKKVRDVIAANPRVKAILLECTELPPYADAIRHATGLPVYDSITTCDFFMSSRMDNPKFGIDDAGMTACMC